MRPDRRNHTFAGISDRQGGLENDQGSPLRLLAIQGDRRQQARILSGAGRVGDCGDRAGARQVGAGAGSVGAAGTRRLCAGQCADPGEAFSHRQALCRLPVFRAGGLLVGTQAFLAMGNQLGVAWGSGTRTLALDVAQGGLGGNVALALPAKLRADVDDALKSLEMGFLPAPGGSRGFASQYVNAKKRLCGSTSLRRRVVPANP